MASKVVRLVTVLVTVPSKDVALNISREVVKQKLVACVNILPSVTSVYEWEGKVEESEELLMMMKTSEERIPTLQEKVLALHPYDVPEFIVLPIEHASPAYGAWITAQTSTTSEKNPQNFDFIKKFTKLLKCLPLCFYPKIVQENKDLTFLD
ncbi:unnamed protein product [Caenorhabditis auriculariae]|uniref:Uncharacterized protein n=1 Tax=Caenorhabditis auriculariae TaxID=2777116 RepID=A0A8S1GY45_9PELO|nr:unnamed protein product [Caenorhabditis auriculariae]